MVLWALESIPTRPRKGMSFVDASVSRLINVQSRHKVEKDTSSPAVFPGASIIDMQKLVRALMEINPGHTIPHSAKVLNMQTETKTCAGDDSL